MKQRIIGWHEVDNMVNKIIRGFSNDGWTPDLLVGVIRGGAIPAMWMSNLTNIKADTITVSFRDHAVKNPYLPVPFLKKIAQPGFKTLIVEDINDTGETLVWIQNKIREYTLDAEKQVKYSALIDNEPSMFKNLHYHAQKINKDIDPEWIVFPWEK